jgi:hypothetical protein
MTDRVSKQMLIEHSGRERSDSVTRWLRSIGWNGAFDADGCNRESTCGTPTPDGYKRLCDDRFRLLPPNPS